MRRVLFLLIFGIAGLAILLSLGTWQMRRLAWKEGLLAEIDNRIAGATVSLPALPDPDQDKYLPVAITGVFDTQELHVLVSVKMVGPGYRIIAPFLTDSGRRILVDRGFVSTAAKQAARAPGPLEVFGNLHWPDEIDGYTPEPDRNSNIWFARDVPAMAAELGTEPVLVIARSRTDPGVTPLPVDSAGIPNDHLQYAITWFGLALVWVAMTLLFLWRSRARTKG
ncbi:SURF1 family protein [Ruegeria aquimaris]|uniref:SURF1-like protein n=1 Tax=Ruegeria aquimaris TaxID=2984333 RepID=A0ABT3AHW2_9RHOB|nr:SURF1 family protein [Ruegeria sp. XHP0148]MCV2888244.1 SURF1 family protein [Ruegeria sp. XHP0148]